MSREHDVRDRMTQRLVEAGHTRADAQKRAVDSLKRCDRDRYKDERRRRQKG